MLFQLGLYTFMRILQTICLLFVLPLAFAYSSPTSSLRTEEGESKLGTPITSLPYSINASGVYSVTVDLPSTSMASGAAITVNSDNVTIELNGHSIANSSASTTAEGVYGLDHKNVTVRNGAVCGFMIGVDLPSSVANGSLSSGNMVEDVAVSGATWIGIRVYGNGNIVRTCRVSSAGGSAANDSNGYGIIAAEGSGNRVLDNNVAGVKAADNSHASYGIWMYQTSDCMAILNRVSQAQYGVAYVSGASGKYRDNLIGPSISYPFSGGTDAGDNGVSGDENDDGVSDSWETTYFGTVNVNLSAFAPNASGLTVLQMYQLGLDPLIEQSSSTLTSATGLTVALSSTQASLSWADPGTSIQYFSVQSSTNGGTTWSNVFAVTGNTFSAAVMGLTLGTKYSFRVTAVGQSGFSTPSTTDSAPVITLTTPLGALLVQ